jgi:C-terminal processing protease CtpA/Prc
MFEMFKNTKAIIFDMRGYPQGTARSIAPRLTEKKNVTGASFQRYVRLGPDLTFSDVGASFTKNHFIQNIPNSDQWKYKGKTVMLMDERTMSQAEHSGLFFEAANGTEYIGSQTAGANGDVTNFSVPGGIRLSFSGHDVRHADGRQLQKTGLVPKVEVRPTVAGIRAGKDEVLERAITYLKTGH